MQGERSEVSSPNQEGHLLTMGRPRSSTSQALSSSKET